MKKIINLILSSALGITATFAQNTLPPNQPEQSSCTPLVICGNTFTSPYSYVGVGTRNDLTASPCSGGEANSVWMRLEVNTPGTIVFTVTPIVATDDYDLIVVDATNVPCDQLTSANVIRCNFNNNSPGSNVNGAIGLNATSTINFVTGGTFGNSFLQQITAAAGDVYLIMLNNFGYYTGSGILGGGFTIDFTGSTATFNQPPAPRVETLIPYCDLSRSVRIKTNQRVKCSSIAADGSDFYLTPSGTIVSAEGINCNMVATGGYADEIILTFANPLPNGFYTLHARQGSDGNSLLNLCDGEIDLPNNLQFQVGINPINIVHIDTPACRDFSITLNSPILCSSISSNFSEFAIVGPSGVAVSNVYGENCNNSMFTNKLYISLANAIMVDGTYELVIGTGSDNNTLIDTCGRSVPVGERIAFTINSFNGKLKALPDNLYACYENEVIDLSGQNSGIAPSGGFIYKWYSNAIIANDNILQTTATLTSLINNFLLETIDSNGCVLRDSTQIIVKPFFTRVNPENSLICENESIIVEAFGGDSFKWSVIQGSAEIENNTAPRTEISPSLGNVVINLEAKDNRGCIDEKQIYLNVIKGPELNLYPKDTAINFGDEIALHASGAFMYQWHPYHYVNINHMPDARVAPKEDTKFIVIGWNEENCPTYDTAYVKVLINSNPFIPNSFTPNGDGLNDFFEINNFKFEKLIRFEVYDKYGTQVYSASHKDFKWDGTYPNGKPAPTGVYFYILEYGHYNDLHQTIKGDITLLR
jgi:gliding motility-associated-like protein